jgi:hypothetical protein
MGLWIGIFVVFGYWTVLYRLARKGARMVFAAVRSGRSYTVAQSTDLAKRYCQLNPHEKSLTRKAPNYLASLWRLSGFQAASGAPTTTSQASNLRLIIFR